MASIFLDTLPLWVLYVIVAALVLLSVEGGWRLGNHQRQRHAAEGKAPVSAPVGATMGLLAFLLAFTFGMAASRFDTRKQVALQEANDHRHRLSADEFSAGGAARRRAQLTA